MGKYFSIHGQRPCQSISDFWVISTSENGQTAAIGLLGSMMVVAICIIGKNDSVSESKTSSVDRRQEEEAAADRTGKVVSNAPLTKDVEGSPISSTTTAAIRLELL
jgi:hypothetical protein